MHSKKHHIIVGMSGGVDSSIAAFLLQKAGHHIEAVFMKNWEEDDNNGVCPATEDIQDAQTICDLLNIPLQIVNFATEYWERVFAYFLEEYTLGRTPNPDILCNKEIKFKAFLEYAKQQGADYIATGHYVRKYAHQDRMFLKKGADPLKDQSYFLSALTEEQLVHSLFPIGELTKHAVRQLAKELGFKNHAKKDSTGICFIGERKFKSFLNDYVLAKPGFIKTLQGETLGTHDGLMFHTIGQRQGLAIGGQKNRPEGAWYVASKNIKDNELIVVQGATHPALYQNELITSRIHWINSPPSLPIKLSAKTRYRQPDQACEIIPFAHQNSTKYRVIFQEPQRAVTPGQFVVFYESNLCLGGGIIE